MSNLRSCFPSPTTTEQTLKRASIMPDWIELVLNEPDASSERSPVDRVGRFWTLMPKLLRGSSESSRSTGGAGGACVAVDCTERARDPSLELLFESLLEEIKRRTRFRTNPLHQTHPLTVNSNKQTQCYLETCPFRRSTSIFPCFITAG